MEKITSTTNQYVKLARSLKNKKERDLTKKFVIEGKKLLVEAIKENIKIDYGLVDENSTELIQFCEQNSIKYFVVDGKILPSLSDTQTPQGIVCVCYQNTQDFALPTGNSLILDRLQDPGNLGAIMRSAAAFNFKDIYLIDCVDSYSEKVVRSSMGNMFKLSLHKATSEQLKNAKKEFKSKFIVADMFGENLSRNCLPKGKFAVIIGNEGKGVSDEMMSLADKTLSIPMQNGVESLNASVSASIIMYFLTQGE